MDQDVALSIHCSREGSVALAGMVELRWISFDTTPPIVSMPSESGVTSSKQRVLDIAGEDCGLNSGSQRDDFVRIQLRVGLRLEQAPNRLANKRNSRRSADENDFRNFLDGDIRVVDALPARPKGTVNEIGVMSWSNRFA